MTSSEPERAGRAGVLFAPGRPVEVVDVMLSEPGPDDVIVRIEAASLCHTDVAVAAGSIERPMPMILGHEGAGVIEWVGSNVVTKQVGDPVVLSANIGCGRCANCQKGKPTVCSWGYPKIFSSVLPDRGFRMTDTAGQGLHQFSWIGTWASRVLVHEASAVKLPAGVPFSVAALIGCCVTTGVGAAINRARVTPGSTVAVIGCGGVGLNVIQGARIAGATTIIGIDPLESKREMALSLGATHVVDSTLDVVSQVLELTGGVGADYAFECVGRPSLVADAWAMSAIDGTVVPIGIPKPAEEAVLPAITFSSTEKTLMATTYGSVRPHLDMPRFAEMYRTGMLDLDRLLTHQYQLSDINRAMEDLRAGISTKASISLR